jgi:hypothetical protein
MSNSIALLGLPGLYQNWLMSALDKDSQLTIIAERNFKYQGSNFDWYYYQQDLKSESYNHVINLYVEEENFIWFLYNFLEKTCEIGIMVDDLLNSLYTKGVGTIAFDQLVKHFTSSYNITSESSEDYCKNAAIEYFYFLLIEKNAEFKIAMFKIKYLTVKNFMSVGNSTQAVNFDRKDLTLVLGENIDLGGDDTGARNGTGKTTIINALELCLIWYSTY